MNKWIKRYDNYYNLNYILHLEIQFSTIYIDDVRGNHLEFMTEITSEQLHEFLINNEKVLEVETK